MLIRNSMDMLAPPRTPGMFAGLGAVPAQTFGMTDAQLLSFFGSEFPWFPSGQVSYLLSVYTGSFGGEVYDRMAEALQNQIQAQNDLNSGNERSYQYALNNPVVGGDPNVWLDAITEGKTRLAKLQTELAKVNDYSSQWVAGYNDWLYRQYEAREAARLADIDARVAAMQQSQARSRAEIEARNVVLAAEDAARNAAIIQQIMDDAAARGAAALAQQTSARDANVVEVLNRQAAGEDLVSVAVDFIRSLGLGPATDVFLAALTGADPGAVLRDIIEPANVIVTGVRSEPIDEDVFVIEAQVWWVWGPDGTPYGTYSDAKRAGLRDDQIYDQPPIAPVTQVPVAPETPTTLQVVVWGPDGTPYGTYSDAKRAGLRDDQIYDQPPIAPVTQVPLPSPDMESDVMRPIDPLVIETQPAVAPETPTTGDPAMLQLPANLTTMTEAQKIAWYRATLAAGFTNEAIRAAVEARHGRQSDSDWTYLRAKAAQTAAQTAAPAGGAGLLIAAAAAAYFLLG